ncbi:hypothetical protein PC129_g22981 [Phytophthora cactorum]|uniref:Uncharacterized protein n=1 Tax=Phytophthora cactorum TaxID=29920 RepID=A0A8T1H1D8_9STRA|nr:hypothetical protein PC111_g23125 [Phytophthora cactorum]KAG2793517.1 hypothetical protein PC112_g23412 [Phytophthora cactorum]KAG2873002.1 hypothetical protein PC114_g26071 [Phytophthora cactorum]KAG2932593.1 hypothetical protein PC117_g13109 [Phytophthora cactorum]KAG2958827.1 hypothetical protein PC118_g23328 [Phytophthora cactorum]
MVTLSYCMRQGPELCCHGLVKAAVQLGMHVCRKTRGVSEELFLCGRSGPRSCSCGRVAASTRSPCRVPLVSRLSNRSRLHRLQAPRRMPHRPLALGKGLLQHGQAWSPAPQSRRQCGWVGATQR